MRFAHFEENGNQWKLYFAAALVTLAAFVLRYLAIPYIGLSSPFLFFFFPIMWLGWKGGIGPALFATMLSAALSWHFFFSPMAGPADPALSLQLILFAISGACVALLGGVARRGQLEAVYERDRFKKVFDQQFQFMALLDPEGRITDINDLPLKIADIRRQDVLGKYFWHSGFWDRLPEMQENWPKRLEEASRSEGPVFSMDTYEAMGELRLAEACITAVRNNEGGMRFFIIQANDITERKKAEELMLAAHRRAEKANAAKTDFLANMSHELRTPMNAVIGLSHLLSETSPLTGRQKEFLGTLRLSAAAMLDLINDLLDIATIELGSLKIHPHPFSALKLVREVADMMALRAREKGLNFQWEADASLDGRAYLGDEKRLRQILLNLTSNAIKFTETGSVRMRIFSHPGQDSKTEILECMIQDTGVGIESDHLESIFDKFSQADSSINRKFGGSGLGLAIAKTLTELMDGTIEVESALARGSTFTVRIPFPVSKENTAGNGEARHRAPAKPTGPFCILLVEDHPANVLVAGTLLENFGYAFEVAGNGIEALQKMAQRRFDAILMDVQMPEMNGFDTTLAIRAREKEGGLPPIPIIGMTAYALVGDKERCLSAGMNEYLPKPYQPEQLKELLQQLLTPHGR